MFLDYEKRKICCRLISCFLPAHRIRICLQDRFGFRPPLLETARKRAGEFSDQVTNCAVLLCFARTYFEQQAD